MTVYRIKYHVTGQAKYISHLDLAQVFERSMRRASIPMAFSEGFNPHPKFSFGSALAVGVCSSGEYMDVELKGYLPANEVKARLNKSLPEGFYADDVIAMTEKKTKLMAVINRAKYIAKLPLLENFTTASLQENLNDLLSHDDLMVMRKTKKGIKERNIRSGIFELEGKIEENIAYIKMTVQTGSEGNVRPEEVIRLLCQKEHIPADFDSVQYHRVGLYVQGEEQLMTPLDVGR